MVESIEDRQDDSSNAGEKPWQKMAREVLAEKSGQDGEKQEEKESPKEKNSFVELLKKENFERLAIDEDLAPSVKRVLTRIQAFFDANSYSENKDYADLLKNCLIEDSDEKLSIRYAELSGGVAGHYIHGKDFKNQRIEINKNISEAMAETESDQTLCHEFIHFLVMRGNRDEKFADEDIIGGGFINEALTESLARQIFPGRSNSYEPQVRMLDFANIITGQRNNYKLFLANGKVDAAQRIAYWKNFSVIADRYQRKTKNNPLLNFDMSLAGKDEDYLVAQRFLIENSVHAHQFEKFDDYVDALEKIQSRPVKDEEWTEGFMVKMDESLARQFCGHEKENQNRREHVMTLLKEFRSIPDELEKYDGREVCEFTKDGITVIVDQEGNVKCHGGPYRQYSVSKETDKTIQSVIVMTMDGEEHAFSIGALTKEDFKKRKQDLLRKREQLYNFLSGKDVKNDLRAFEEMPEGTQRLESFTIPIITDSETKTKFQTIRIATAEDGTVGFSGAQYREIGDVSNIHQMQFIGRNAGPDQSLYGNPMPQIQSGKVFSCLSEQGIRSGAIAEIKKWYIEHSTKEQLDHLLDWLKRTPDYDAEDENMSDKDWIDFAAQKYIKANYQNIDKNYRHSVEKKIIDDSPKFIVSEVEGKTVVASLRGASALSYKSQVLYDKSNSAPLNDYRTS